MDTVDFHLLKTYELGTIISVVPFRNGGFIITTDNQKFWLKPLHFSYQIKSIFYDDNFTNYLKLRGFPARCFVRTSTGNLISQIEDQKYCLLDYFEGSFQPDSSATLTNNQLAQAARKLAELHMLSQGYQGPRYHNPPFVSQKVYNLLHKVIQKIEALPERDNFAILACEAIKRKLEYILKSPFEKQNFIYETPVMNHGDYHAGNIVFDDTDNVVAILDFEHCRDISRIWDIGWALTWLCRDKCTEAFAGSMNINRIDAFLRNYHEIYPLSLQEVNNLATVCVSSCYHSYYLLDLCYLQEKPISSIVRCSNLEEWFWWADQEANVRDLFTAIASRKVVKKFD